MSQLLRSLDHGGPPNSIAFQDHLLLPYKISGKKGLWLTVNRDKKIRHSPEAASVITDPGPDRETPVYVAFSATEKNLFRLPHFF